MYTVAQQNIIKLTKQNKVLELLISLRTKSKTSNSCRVR